MPFVHGQSKSYKALSNNEIVTLQQNMQQATAKLKSLQADFVQTKNSTLFAEPSIQNGKLYFHAPSDLCWQYITPNRMSIVMHNDEMVIKTVKENTINAPKGVQEMIQLICNAINGNFLAHAELFDIQYYKDKNYILYLVPKQKRLKNMYQNIVIFLGEQHYIADKVILTEQNGDETSIIFKNQKINESIPESYFSTK